MTSSRPYLIRAIYEWLLDNYLTPHILVDTDDDEVSVPEQYIEDNQIVLNIETSAIAHLDMGNESLDFNARFSGVAHTLHIPIRCIKAIYAQEEPDRGMFFTGDDDEADATPSSGKNKAPRSSSSKSKKHSGRPTLKIVK